MTKIIKVPCFGFYSGIEGWKRRNNKRFKSRKIVDIFPKENRGDGIYFGYMILKIRLYGSEQL